MRYAVLTRTGTNAEGEDEEVEIEIEIIRLAGIASKGLYVWIGFRIARSAPDPFGQYIAVGFTTMFGLTAVLHMAVNLALVPTTGMPLPFISYGRSSLVVTLAATGVLISVARARRA